jgi:anti-sigma regulatory factor (Ser/Thr protein kinase)
MRARLRAYLEERLVPDTVVTDVVLCVHEAATNGLRCGGGEVDVHVWLRSGRVIASVKDHGAGFAFRRQVLPDPTATGGRGLYMIRCLMDAVEIECSRGTLVHMEKRLPAADALRRRRAAVRAAS